MKINDRVSEVGQEYMGTVKEIREVKGNYDPQIVFSFHGNADELYLPVSSASRQLMRCGFATTNAEGADVPDYNAAEGQTLIFGRDHNPKGKPYWRISIADGVDEAAAKPKAPKMTQEHVAKALDLHPHPKPTSTGTGKTFDDLVQTYKAVWATVSAAQGAGATAESVNAGVATLMIHADKHGIPLPAKLERLTSAKAAKPQPDADPADDLPF